MYQKTKPIIHSALGALLLLLPASSSAAPIAPETVSPGDFRAATRVASGCPTFSWSSTTDATGQELQVYEVPDGLAAKQALDAEPILRVELAPGASSWTPALEQCLEPAGRYAWVVGTVDREGTPYWSDVRLFETAVSRGSELEQALERVLARFVEQQRLTEQQAVALLTDPSPLVGAAEEVGLAPTTPSVLIQDPDVTGLYSELGGTLQQATAVFGRVDNDFDLAVGVRGETTTQTHVAYGVLGITDDKVSGNANGSAGVYGLSGTGVSDWVAGVLGRTSSTNEQSAGVRGEGRRGVMGIGDGHAATVGVVGVTSNDLTGLTAGTGVFGRGKRGVVGRSSEGLGVAGDFQNTNSAGVGLKAAGGAAGADLELSRGRIDLGTDALGKLELLSGEFTGDGAGLTNVAAETANNADKVDGKDADDLVLRKEAQTYIGTKLTISGSSTLEFEDGAVLNASALTTPNLFRLPSGAGSITGAGSGSGLNADRVDNLEAGSFLRSDFSDNYTIGTLTFSPQTELAVQGVFDASSPSGVGGPPYFQLPDCVGCITGGGPNSGLDADTLDGLHKDAFLTTSPDSLTLPNDEVISNAIDGEVTFEDNGAMPSSNEAGIDVFDVNSGISFLGRSAANPGVSVSLRGENGAAGATGGIVQLVGGNGDGSAAGGDVFLLGGLSGAGGSLAGGNIVLQPGNGLGSAGEGKVKITNNVLLLDSDNTGNGADVRIIANQGSDTGGTAFVDEPQLRYNSGDNLWELSHNGTQFFTIATGTGGGGINADTLDGINSDGFLQLIGGSQPLGAEWDAGGQRIRAETFHADVGLGSPPFVVTSATKVDNLNADLLDGFDSSVYVRLANGETLDTNTNQIFHFEDSSNMNSLELDFNSSSKIELRTVTGTGIPDLDIHAADDASSPAALILSPGFDGISAFGDLRTPSLANCDTIDTDGSGNLSCGTDEDDVTDNQIGELQDVSEAGADSGEALVSNGSGGWAPSANAVCQSDGTNCPADADTNAGTICSGSTTYLDGNGGCDDISSVYAGTSHGHVEADIGDLSHTIDTSADTICAGGTTYLDGEGNCDDISSVYAGTSHGHVEADIGDLSHTVDTSADTICAGGTTYLDGEGNCDDISSVYAGAGHDHSSLGVTSTVTIDNVLALTPRASAPGSPAEGTLYVDATGATGTLCFYDGTTWQVVSGAGSCS